MASTPKTYVRYNKKELRASLKILNKDVASLITAIAMDIEANFLDYIRRLESERDLLRGMVKDLQDKQVVGRPPKKTSKKRQPRWQTP